MREKDRDRAYVPEDMALTECIGSEADMLDQAPCGICQFEAGGDHRFSYVSAGMLRMLGYTEQSFREKFGNCAVRLIWPEDLAQVRTVILQQLERGPEAACECRIETGDGALKWVYGRGKLQMNESGRRWFNVCIMDCDESKARQLEMEWREIKYRMLVEMPGALVCDYDPRADRLSVEYPMTDGGIRGGTCERFFRDIESVSCMSMKTAAEQRSAFADALNRPRSGILDFRARLSGDGEYHWYRFRYASLADGGGHVYRVIGRADVIDADMRAITDFQRSAVQESPASILRGELAEPYIDGAMQKFRGGILLILAASEMGMDGAPPAGSDASLPDRLSAIIRSAFRREDILARGEGGVFIIFMPGATDPALAATKAQGLLDRIHGIRVQGGGVRCGIGIALTKEKVSAGELIHRADMALRQVGRQGGDGYVIFGC